MVSSILYIAQIVYASINLLKATIGRYLIVVSSKGMEGVSNSVIVMMCAWSRDRSACSQAEETLFMFRKWASL